MLVIFVDDEAALGEVGLVVELGCARGACGVERYAKHPQRVLLAQVYSGVPHIHQPLQQGEEVLLVVLYCPGYGLLQLGLSGKGARQLISGLDPLLGHLGLLLACARSGPVGHTLSDTGAEHQAGMRPLRTRARRMFLHILPKRLSSSKLGAMPRWI